MTYSRDLQELRQLLRQGFSIEQIVAKVGAGVSEPDSGIEITKTPKGSTANIRYRTDAASCVHPDGPSTLTIRDDVHRTEVRLKRAASERVLCSEEKDFWDFTLAMHPSLDAQGNRVLRRFRDTGRQIEDTKRLVTLALDPQKRAEYLRASFDNSKRQGRLEPEDVAPAVPEERGLGRASFLAAQGEVLRAPGGAAP